MAETAYTYSVSVDFVGLEEDAPNLDRFTDEIEGSNIATDLNRTTRTGDVVKVRFADALSSEDESTLDSLVAAHDGICYSCCSIKVKEKEESSTTSTQWQDKINHTTGILIPGDWYIEWKIDLKVGISNEKKGAVSLYIDGEEEWYVERPVTEEFYSQELGATTLDFADTETHTVQLRFKNIGPNDNQVWVRKAKVQLYFMS